MHLRHKNGLANQAPTTNGLQKILIIMLLLVTIVIQTDEHFPNQYVVIPEHRDLDLLGSSLDNAWWGEEE